MCDSEDEELFTATITSCRSDQEAKELLFMHTVMEHEPQPCPPESQFPVGSLVKLIPDENRCMVHSGRFWDATLRLLCFEQLDGTVLRHSGDLTFVLFPAVDGIVIGASVHRTILCKAGDEGQLVEGSFVLQDSNNAAGQHKVELYNEASSLVSAGNYERATMVLSTALELPDDTGTFFLLLKRSHALLMQKEYAKAAEDAKTAFALSNRKSVRALTQQAHALMLLGSFQESLRVLCDLQVLHGNLEHMKERLLAVEAACYVQNKVQGSAVVLSMKENLELVVTVGRLFVTGNEVFREVPLVSAPLSEWNIQLVLATLKFIELNIGKWHDTLALLEPFRLPSCESSLIGLATLEYASRSYDSHFATWTTALQKVVSRVVWISLFVIANRFGVPLPDGASIGLFPVTAICLRQGQGNARIALYGDGSASIVAEGKICEGSVLAIRHW